MCADSEDLEVINPSCPKCGAKNAIELIINTATDVVGFECIWCEEPYERESALGPYDDMLDVAAAAQENAKTPG